MKMAIKTFENYFKPDFSHLGKSRYNLVLGNRGGKRNRMKAILIIDEMPQTCEDCHLRLALDRYRCINTKENRLRWCGDEDGFYTSDTKPSWCPLRPLPKHKYGFEDGGLKPSDQILFQSGWNACLDEITGETE